MYAFDVAHTVFSASHKFWWLALSFLFRWIHLYYLEVCHFISNIWEYISYLSVIDLFILLSGNIQYTLHHFPSSKLLQCILGPRMWCILMNIPCGLRRTHILLFLLPIFLLLHSLFPLHLIFQLCICDDF